MTSRSASATTRERTRANQSEKANRPSAITVPRWKPVNFAWVSASKPTHASAHTTSRPAPRTVPAIRTPNGRHVCGKVGSAGAAGRSEPAGMDVGEQDAAGTDVEQLVHQSLGAVARDHRADRDPALAMKRRDGRALDAGGEGDGGVDVG